MNELRAVISTLLCLCLTAICQAPPALGQLPELKPADSSLVVLKNSQVMRGTIREQNELIEIDTGNGTRSLIPKERVWFYSQSTADAYWEMVGRTRASDVDGQIRILHFCLRNSAELLVVDQACLRGVITVERIGGITPQAQRAKFKIERVEEHQAPGKRLSDPGDDLDDLIGL